MFIYEYGYKLSGIRMNVRTQGQLSPLEIGEDNSKFEPKKLRKIPSIWPNKRLLYGFLGMLSPNLASVLC